MQETRYAILKEPDVFDREKLSRFAAAVPEGYEVRQISEELVPVLLAEEWSKDFCSAFDSAAPPPGAGGSLRRAADPGVSGPGAISQLGCP